MSQLVRPKNHLDPLGMRGLTSGCNGAAERRGNYFLLEPLHVNEW